ncbi:MAG: histidine ammonia-lyase [Acidimicrobiia bacterium]|nr:histidine ammonia-lyase [Acidimicrobiia bacterium]
MAEISLTGTTLTREDVVAVARADATVDLSAEARSAMETSRRFVDELESSGEPAYGVSTGFGALATTFIPQERRRELQRNLIRSHAAGMGPRVEREVVRAMMLLRARTLAMGRSGIRPTVVDTMLALLNADITPVVYEYGSLGASGDLAPLAHAALALIGEGTVEVGNGEMEASAALSEAGIEPVVLEAKEGLALINGTDGILGMLVLALADLTMLLDSADIAAAMSVEGLLGTDRAFAADVVEMRPHAGQARSAANMRAVLAGSAIVASHRHDDPRVQDAYSLRCTPQVNGAARDAVGFATQVAEDEMRSAIDNPVVMADGRIESGGNFHGAPLGMACDYLAIAAAEVGAIAERRVDRMLDPSRSHGLPAFLTNDPGASSGLMIAQYTAASIAAENRRLAAPASVDSLPTSAMQEDHVSMGWGAARKLRRSVANLGRLIAIELVTAAQAVELRDPDPSPVSARVIARLRETVPTLTADRVLAPDLAAAAAMVMTGGVPSAAAL